MPALLTDTPTTEQRQSAFRLGLLIDAPKEGKGGQAPVVWYWSVANHPRSWLGSWVPPPGTTWWWTYCPLAPGNRGRSEEFEAVLAVFRSARRVWLDTHGFRDEE